MDQTNKDQPNFIKRTLQLILSASIVCLILCSYSASAFSLFLDYTFNIYFSTFLFSFFTHTLERKYMFLICNGILAFVARTSISCTSSPNPNFQYASVLAEEEVLVESTDESLENVTVLLAEEEDEDEEEVLKGSTSFGEEGRESEVFVAENEDNEEEISESVEKQEEEEEYDNGDQVEKAASIEDGPSTEELNERIEEFIRKMKEEIRIQAQQQLIAV